MVKKNTQKITIFGSGGSIGRYLSNQFSLNYEVIGVSRKKFNKNIININFSEFIENSNYYIPKKNIHKKKIFQSRSIILTIGKFKKTGNDLNQDIDKANFQLNYKFLNFLIKNKNKFTKPCKIIVITSMNSIFPNQNSLAYCISKSKLSNAIENFKIQIKKSKLSIENLMPGPIDTQMRNNKISDNLKVKDIFHVCNFLIGLSEDATLGSIKIFNKKNYFISY